MTAGLMGELVTTPKTIAEQVYNLLRSRILEQQIKPGERLLEIAVCESLNVSRTPVREAFRLLQQDGLVERIPQGGVRVTGLSLEELKEISALRTVLEVYAVELACDLIEEEEIEKLEQILSQAAALVSAEAEGKSIDVAELSRLNTVFHDTICSAARSAYLNKILEIVRLPILRFRPFSLGDREHRLRGVTEHRQMVTMLRQRDKNGLKELTAKHVGDVSTAIARMLASNQGT
ncbi:GntR family transcriptional regulator [Desulfofustis limnaeus]|jgi:DNA-binding GntR family transcriptional regulator|uniref:GntR family transcriptional regulator n=1 Tax=Desulfofustis limnaeus TaxID=2740163 RepID=A0ABM7WAF7_9BACT|nr:GntR family transcriptional regulator [Desulfofustis limnaeus]MDX9895536.1 GntR family transcriptional regulator [Desulfofustis sp.]BDD87937.1 GntR family transcriptional regulator [Desulfofustis limnaeus]